MEQINDMNYHNQIVTDEKGNRVGIEFNTDKIRIDGMEVKNHDSFISVMNMLVVLAKKEGYTKLFYADHLADKYLKWFKQYGFEEKEDVDPFNHYLYLYIKEDIK